MGQSGHRGGARPISRYLKVLLPSPSNSGKLAHTTTVLITIASPAAALPPARRISDELAGHWDGGDVGSGGVVPVVSPFGKVWRVEVGRDAEGAFLGRGWPEFAAAHGFGSGWFLVLRHEAGGVLTVKALDTTLCLREFGRPLTAANHGGGGTSRRPQFINVILPPSMEKMFFPPRFVEKYIAEPETGTSTAVLFGPLGKFCRVTVEKDQSGNLFFSGGWSRFLASNGIAQYDVVLLRYEGNMVFTVKVFGPDGCQKGCKDQDTSPLSRGSKGLQQREIMGGSGNFNNEEKDPPTSSKKRKSAAKKSDDGHTEGSKTEEEDPPTSSKKPKSLAKKPADSEENTKGPRRCTASSNNPLPSTKTVYEIGPPSWMKMGISKYIRSNRITVAGHFCKAIGLQKTSEITLRTNTDGLRSWKVGFIVYANRSSGGLTRGWLRFCSDNGIEEGDVCTFNIVKTTLWHVDITRRRG